jgi:hypothetical protein
VCKWNKTMKPMGYVGSESWGWSGKLQRIISRGIGYFLVQILRA